jgi:drug/metabolite transporter (DMT)-like permease
MSSKLRSDLILLLAAIIWGFAFVAQRAGMEFVGPFTFNGVRFTLGTLVLIPFLFLGKKMNNPAASSGISKSFELLPPQEAGNGPSSAGGVFKPKDTLIVHDNRKIILGVICAGILLFTGVSLQQVGLQTTTAGKAGFITGLYVIFVPVVGVFLGHRTNLYSWFGVIFSATGLYLLSVKSGFRIEHGDLLVMVCAVAFTFHVLLIGWLSPKMNSLHLAMGQFTICAILNLIVAYFIEPINSEKIMNAAIPILYAGILSVGIAYTLQVIAQKEAHPDYASIILSMEAVFAAIGGWVILHESLRLRWESGSFLKMAGL